MMTPAKHNSTMEDKAMGLSIEYRFVPRCPFLPTAAAKMHASWTKLCPTLYQDT